MFGAAPQATKAVTLAQLEQALIAGKILCYAQGFALISAASKAFDWPMPLPEIARVWREGCIIRSSMLNDMATALTEDASRNLMLAPFFADHLKQRTALCAKSWPLARLAVCRCLRWPRGLRGLT